MTSELEAKALVEKIIRDALQLLFTRNCGHLEIDESAATEEEMITDIVSVMVGDDPGCLDSEDEDDAALIEEAPRAIQSFAASQLSAERKWWITRIEQERDKWGKGSQSHTLLDDLLTSVRERGGK